MDARRKKLLFQSQHCGIRENDILLGRFAERHLEGFSDGQLDQFEALLEESDLDLYNWIIGKQSVPGRLNHEVMNALIKFAEEL